MLNEAGSELGLLVFSLDDGRTRFAHILCFLGHGPPSPLSSFLGPTFLRASPKQPSPGPAMPRHPHSANDPSMSQLRTRPLFFVSSRTSSRHRYVYNAEASEFSIETVNGDVFLLIADELHAEGGSLHNFSLASHSLRRLALPALFSHCKFDIRNSTQALYLPPPGDAPESIRPFMRYVYLLLPR